MSLDCCANLINLLKCMFHEKLFNVAFYMRLSFLKMFTFIFEYLVLSYLSNDGTGHYMVNIRFKNAIFNATFIAQ